MITHSFLWGERKIEFETLFGNRKVLTIKVYPDTRIEVLAPLYMKKEQIVEKVRQKAPWILKQINSFNNYKPATPARRFINGETHLYLGRQYRLKIVPGNENAVKAYRGQLWMQATDTGPELLKQQLDRWYRQKATIVFNELLEEVLPRFNRYKIKKPILSIRYMSRRWGSCTPGGKIILNTELIKAPKGSIEYVIVHELSHLVHHNHTRAFQNLQSRMLPNWQKWKERLEYSLA